MITRPDFRVALTGNIPEAADRVRNQYEIRRWCRQYTLISSTEQAAWFERISKDKTVKMFGVGTKPPPPGKGGATDDGGGPIILARARSEYDLTPIGVCGLTSIDHVNQKAEFSLYIVPEQQNKGYGKEALSLLVEHGFRDFNLNRIWGETYDGNPAIKMFEALGFKKEGTLRQSYFREGRFIDSHIYAKIRGEI